MIIKENKHIEKYYDAKCSSCGSILQINEQERICIDGIGLDCPCCKAHSTIELMNDNYIYKNNSQKKYTDFCDNCNREYTFTKEDVKYHGKYGLAVVECPFCGKDSFTEDDFVLTADNFEFPNHFERVHAIEDGGNAVNTFDKELVTYIKKGIDYLRSHKNCREWGGHITGNIFLDIHKFVGDEVYEINCSKDFYTTIFNFNHDDYVHKNEINKVVEQIREQCEEDKKSLCDEFLYENVKLEDK